MSLPTSEESTEAKEQLLDALLNAFGVKDFETMNKEGMTNRQKSNTTANANKMKRKVEALLDSIIRFLILNSVSTTLPADGGETVGTHVVTMPYDYILLDQIERMEEEAAGESS